MTWRSWTPNSSGTCGHEADVVAALSPGPPLLWCSMCRQDEGLPSHLLQGEGWSGEGGREEKGKKSRSVRKKTDHHCYYYCAFSFQFHASDFQCHYKQCGRGNDIHYLLSTVMESNSVCLGGGARVCSLALPSSWPIGPRGLPRGPWMVASLPCLSHLSPCPPHGHPQALLSWPRNPCVCLVPPALPCRPGPILHIRPGIFLGEYLFLFVWGALPCSHEGEGENVCK